ncbi:hypothetical protein [Acidovorax sp. Root267]|uniref:hypothetical protein n=1 Tax=Acidovorax sp. Root267 TaxID=1736505 RepID=UPI0009EB0AB1|nr:hypothetical protein [Acidovorax sp. Root267]
MTPAFPPPSHGGPRTGHPRVCHARLVAVLALCCVALSACGPELQGSPKPPKAFGPVQSSWFGCPPLQGVYAWPPVDASGVHGNRPSNRRWEQGGLPFYVNGPEMQIWVQQAGGEMTMRTRTINRARNIRSSLTRRWSLVTYGGAQTRCTSGMLDVVPQDIPEGKDAGGTGVLQGFRLALLKDGALAVGTRTVSTGNKGSYFSWGGQSYGTYDAPDVETWSWSKLARTAPGDREPSIVDAYVPGATAP